MRDVGELDRAISAVAPIDGVRVGSKTDPSSWRIDFQASATAEQIAAANAVLSGWTFEGVAARLVDEERDRRLRTFAFAGVVYDFDEISRNRIDKARGSALAAIIAGAEANDLRWADANNDFGWIAADNSFNTMDAPTTLAFGNAAAAWEGLHIVAARALKNMNPIPSDYATNATYWPSA